MTALSKDNQKDHLKLFYIIILFNLIAMSRGKGWGKERLEDSYRGLLRIDRVSNKLFIVIENSEV